MDRNELAARFAVADYGAKCRAYYAGGPKGPGPDVYSGTAEDAFKMADLFLDYAERIDARPAKSTLTPAPVPPPAPTPAPEDDAAADARIDAILDDRKDADAIKAAAVRQRAEHRATYGPEYPAPEAKRPTHVRITGPKGQLSVTIGKVYEVLYFDDDRARLIIKNDDGVEWGLSNKPDEGPAFPTWAPAPCPPPVAGSAETTRAGADLAKDVRWALDHAVDGALGLDGVNVLRRALEQYNAALSRPVRP